MKIHIRVCMKLHMDVCMEVYMKVSRDIEVCMKVHKIIKICYVCIYVNSKFGNLHKSLQWTLHQTFAAEITQKAAFNACLQLAFMFVGHIASKFAQNFTLKAEVGRLHCLQVTLSIAILTQNKLHSLVQFLTLGGLLIFLCSHFSNRSAESAYSISLQKFYRLSCNQQLHYFWLLK